MAETIINGVRVPFVPIGNPSGAGNRLPIDLPADRSFKQVFDKELQSVKFSKHAQQRLDSRNITLNDQDKTKIENAVSMAEKKGSQDSLVLLRDMAFIVNIKNRTVVTAMDKESMSQNVFTNIDSAVVAE
ncbi:MAG TPA: flagellar protein [Bacteroidetes bacterium]|nr:flagellar protein [Bacteroidota bacterium]